MTEPPAYVIEAARLAAIQSPCAKSKRGVALFDPEEAGREAHAPGELVTARDRLAFRASRVLISSAFNGPPTGFTCKNTMVCRGWCREVCLHAEQRAITAALCHEGLAHLELVHVKVVGDQVVAGGGPSCLQCSKLVVEVGLRGVWLFELDAEHSASAALHGKGRWRFYSAAAFHEDTLASNGIASLGAGA